MKTNGKRTFQPSYLLFLLVCLLIMMLVLVPIGYMVVESITLEEGGVSLGNFVKYFSRSGIRESLMNTLIVALGIGTFGTLLGVTLAFGVSRTNMRFKTLVKSTIIVAIMVSPRQRVMIAKMASEINFNRLPLLVGVLEQNSQAVIESCHALLDQGLDHFVITPPYYLPFTTQAELVCHYERIASHVPGNIILYNIPQN
ncbi:dihydrodipicolinate synthase family protein, partial [Eubacteriales bacterium OttesenSCG-928-N13]|nr:dihydrodipicolinate synthase family protein [Eubacteriales bacterium OttesenSCG-928-N13]